MVSKNSEFVSFVFLAIVSTPDCLFLEKRSAYGLCVLIEWLRKDKFHKFGEVKVFSTDVSAQSNLKINEFCQEL